MSRIVVVGGGIAGLSVAGLLAVRGHRVTLIEKMFELGGRSIMQERDGFHLNYGAHAVYARDQSAMQKVLDTLAVRVDFVAPDLDMVRYITETGKETVPAVSLAGLLHTKLLPRFRDKAYFVYAILSILASAETSGDNVSFQEWLDRRNWTLATRNLLLHLVATNFFTERPGDLRASTVLRYYRRVLRTKHPVSYIVGGWGALVQSLRERLEKAGVQILEKTAITGLQFEQFELKRVQSRNGVFEADIFVLCAPPTALKRLVADTPLSPFVVPYAAEEPNTALVYDVALTKRVRNDVSYVSDMKRHVFITDPSLYDSSCVPDGGQLLQAIAYTSADTADDEAVLTERRNDIESLYDAYYPGWREALAFSRVTDQAVVQGIGWGRDQKRLPTHFQDFPNVYFAGDWCAAAGSVSDVAFASALTVASAVGMAL